MRGEELLLKMELADLAFVEAADAPVRHAAPGRRRRAALRRALVLAAVVLAVTAICLTAALAVSPELRELVFRFFHVGPEQVILPPPVDTALTEEDMYAEPRISIGGMIEGRTVHAPVSTGAGTGVFLVCTDEVETRQGGHYDAYYEEDGELVKLEEHKFREEYSLYGEDFYVAFDWARHGGEVSVTWVEANEPYGMYGFSGDASRVLFHFDLAGPGGSGDGVSMYPVLLDLYTGELTDILAGSGAWELGGIANYAMSGDGTGMLLCRSRASGGGIYYVDVVQGNMYSLDELSGEHVDSCSLAGGKLACWSRTDGLYRAWSLDLGSFERAEIFGPTPYGGEGPGIVFLMGFDDWIHDGALFAGSSFALETDGDGNVSAIDLATGERIAVEGFRWPKTTDGCDLERHPSPDGKKLLLAGGAPGRGFDYVGILDFEKKTMAEFDRNNLSAGRELLPAWFDDSTVVIEAGAEETYLSRDFYLYSLGG